MLPTTGQRHVNGSQRNGRYAAACRSPPYRPAGCRSEKINASAACDLYLCQETLFAVARTRTAACSAEPGPKVSRPALRD